MPYGRRSFKKRAYSRRKGKSKTRKTYRRKVYRRRTTRASYRGALVPRMQMANAKATKPMVRFQGQQTYTVIAPSAGTANTKSILRVPITFLGNPVSESGTWTPQSGEDFVYSMEYNEWFNKYLHYRVMGAKVEVHVKQRYVGPSSNEQADCLATVARVGAHNTFTPAVENKSIWRSLFCTTKQWGGYNTGASYRQCYLSQKYSPRKQFAFKDTKDADGLISDTTYNIDTELTSYINIIIAGQLDQPAAGHQEAVVAVKCSYIVQFLEPTLSNTPMATA